MSNVWYSYIMSWCSSWSVLNPTVNLSFFNDWPHNVRSGLTISPKSTLRNCFRCMITLETFTSSLQLISVKFKWVTVGSYGIYSIMALHNSNLDKEWDLFIPILPANVRNIGIRIYCIATPLNFFEPSNIFLTILNHCISILGGTNDVIWGSIIGNWFIITGAT